MWSMGCLNLCYPETASLSSLAQETFPRSPAPITVAPVTALGCTAGAQSQSTVPSRARTH